MQNFRSFVDSGRIELGQMNVLIGANNSGKSSILRGLHQLQQGLEDILADVRVGSSEAQIDIDIVDIHGTVGWPLANSFDTCTYTVKLHTADRRSGSSEHRASMPGGQYVDFQLPNVEPNHFIVPYLSKRKTASYGEDVREQSVFAIMPNMSNLAAKLSRLSNPAFPAHSEYADACQSILGFMVTAIPSLNG
ncbi:AAA family ATPase [Oculatella sp. FACHB-28]|nr:AAA family ATPase [Oculatella sp. FACHB-28]